MLVVHIEAVDSAIKATCGEVNILLISKPTKITKITKPPNIKAELGFFLGVDAIFFFII